ncbi:hypothetical protein PsorP6_013823 [Peronosclerospora sorghi]|uniref:Uncharacterized protein n=1 Tax=Peronosclerospora sorghi TaxID=230839 RepID=A0ACC0VHY0_9STRA|nr:hypothetical protein PsorP6_013823 [Peronosclerospora sorghi]
MATNISSSRTRTVERMRNFKKGIDADETRRRREDTTIQIRKNQREERLNRRRRLHSTVQAYGYDILLDHHNNTNADSLMETADESPHEPMRSLNGVSVSDLPKVAAMIQSLDSMEQATALSKLRRLLALENDPPIQEVVSLGVVPILADFLKQHKRPEVQFDAAWALTNITSGTTAHTEVVIKCGVIELLCELLLSPNEDVCGQAVWALGNIAGDSTRFRDLVLNAGAMMPLLAVLRRYSRVVSILRTATWTLSNLCRGKPSPEFALVSPALTLFPHLIHSPDTEVLTDACWALSSLSDGTTETIQAIIDSGVCRPVVDLLDHSLASIKSRALHIIGNMLTGNAQQTQYMLDLGIIPRLAPLLKHEKHLVRQGACWVISNITSGTPSQIHDVLEANVIPPLLMQLQSNHIANRKEAAWAVLNVTTGGNPKQIDSLVEQGCIPSLVDCLKVPDARVIILALEALDNILRVGEAEMSLTDTENRMARYIEEAEGIERIQELQFHQEQEIYEKSMCLLRDYFDGEVEEDDNVAPAMDYDSHQFTFGMDGQVTSTSAGENRFNF